jgi:hypothetical protein
VIRVLVVLAAAVALAGCGGNGDAGGETTDPTGHEATSVVVYFLRDGKVWPVEHDVHDEGGAMSALTDGPTEREASELGLTSEHILWTRSDGLPFITILDEDLSDEGRAQVVYTLTRDPAVKSFEIDGKRYTRADFEAQTPSVLVESPLAFQEVSSPLVARGTANTFEATFSFEILNEDGEVIAGDFATATSGSGTRGTFRFEQPFVVEAEQDGVLRIFELSAESGSRTNEVEIPLRLLP